MNRRVTALVVIILLSTFYAEGQYRSKDNELSLGVTLGGGVGFEKFTLFYDENGESIYLSTGGGFSFGADFGYDIAEKFNLSLQGFYQVSSPSKQVKNASGTFSRFGVTLTPAYIIPLGNDKMFRLLPGAGVGFYTLSTMNIDASEIGGEEMTFKYKSTIGFHASLMFQVRFSDHSTLGTGLKYYNMAYDYTEEGSTHIPMDSKVVEPNGSGIDLIVGYYYKF